MAGKLPIDRMRERKFGAWPYEDDKQNFTQNQVNRDGQPGAAQVQHDGQPGGAAGPPAASGDKRDEERDHA